MKNKISDDRGISLVELLVVISIMVVMTGVVSLGLGMMFSRDANYVAVRIDDMLSEARMVSMSRAGDFTYEVHIDDTDPKLSYAKITDSGGAVYKEMRLDKGVTVRINGTDTTDFSVEFDKAKGNVTKVEIDGTETSADVYNITVTAKRNPSKIRTVTLVSTTGRHYTDK